MIHIMVVFGADDRIRTGDLILTKDALYLLSYISISRLLGFFPSGEIYYSTVFQKLQYLNSTFLYFLYLFFVDKRCVQNISRSQRKYDRQQSADERQGVDIRAAVYSCVHERCGVHHIAP